MYGFENDSLNIDQMWAEHGSVATAEQLPAGVVDSADPNYWLPEGMGREPPEPVPAVPVPGEAEWTAGHVRVDKLTLDSEGFVDSGTFELGSSEWSPSSATHYLKEKLASKGYDVECCGGCSEGSECHRESDCSNQSSDSRTGINRFWTRQFVPIDTDRCKWQKPIEGKNVCAGPCDPPPGTCKVVPVTIDIPTATRNLQQTVGLKCVCDKPRFATTHGDGTGQEIRCGVDATDWWVDWVSRLWAHQFHPTPFHWLSYPMWLDDTGDSYNWTKPGGPGDLKPPGRSSYGKKCPINCDRSITFCGYCINYQIPGNIAFGVFGSAASPLGGFGVSVFSQIGNLIDSGKLDSDDDQISIGVGSQLRGLPPSNAGALRETVCTAVETAVLAGLFKRIKCPLCPHDKPREKKVP